MKLTTNLSTKRSAGVLAGFGCPNAQSRRGRRRSTQRVRFGSDTLLGQLLALLFLATTAAQAGIATNAPVRGIMDNSFLVEEAYNQEAGIVQHIFTAARSVRHVSGPDDRAWDLSFTQEWPLSRQTHQVSYTIPFSAVDSGGQSDSGFGDVLLNYRYQALFDESTLTAFAPRLSLILPTGDADKGFGDDTLGYQPNLPFSTALHDRWSANANAGLTFLPDAGTGPTHDLLSYNLGASAIYAASERLHLMLEWVGTWDEFSTGPGTDREFASVLSPGLRYAFNYASDTQLVLGIATPIGLNDAAPDYGVFFYVSFEHGFGSKK